jgi:hypothetical protein
MDANALPARAALITGLDGPLARAIARRLAAEGTPLVLAAPYLCDAREAATEANRLRTLRHEEAPTIAMAADPAKPGEAFALLEAARAAAGPLGHVVTCAPLGVSGSGDGAPVPSVDSFAGMLDAVAKLPPGRRPHSVVLAARAFPPLDAADARAILSRLGAEHANELAPTTVHVFAAVDPHAGAAARAFGLLDRPFGADIEFALRRLEGAADEVHALLCETG